MPTESNNTNNHSLHFFSLPLDVLYDDIFSRLHLTGPAVEWIEGDPSEEQRKVVIATNKPPSDKSNTSAVIPDLSTYHLIKDVDPKDPNNLNKYIYAIGFCVKEKDGTLVYKKETLDDKSPLA